MLETIGYDPRMDRWAIATDATVGRVTSVDEGIASVLTEAGSRRAGCGGGLLARMAVDPGEAPCAGDWCVLRTWPEHRATVERLLPRSTVLVDRPSPTGVVPVLCANADLVAVVVAARSETAADAVECMVDRVVAGGARPLVVVTTTGAGAEPGDEPGDEPGAVPLALQVVERVGGEVGVRTVCAATGHGVPALRDLVAGRLTMALTGAAGQGRRALVAALVGAQVVRGRGLVPLPSGGAVIDTPDLTCEPAPRRPTTVIRTGGVW